MSKRKMYKEKYTKKKKKRKKKKRGWDIVPKIFLKHVHVLSSFNKDCNQWCFLC